MIEYHKGVKKEAEKIVFPEKKEVKRNTIIVFGVCTFAAIYLWGITSLVIEALKAVM